MKKTLLSMLLSGFVLCSFAQSNEHSRKISYVKNNGQWESNVLYKAQIGGGLVWLEQDRFSFVFQNQSDLEEAHENRHHKKAREKEDIKIRSHAYRLQFIGCNSGHPVLSNERSEVKHNYFIGNDPQKWAGNVPLFQEVRYNELYEGVDLKIYSDNGYFKYDYIVKPGAIASSIKWKYDGVSPVINDGKLYIGTNAGEVIEEKPYAYQLINGKIKEVACKYKLSGEELCFSFPKGYDTSTELVIDPTLIFSTYTGSTADNWGFTATYDNNGSLYSGGIVFGAGYPVTAGAFDASFSGGNTDVSISKFTPTGNALVYSTYLGGSNTEAPHSLIVDSNGDLFIMGTTSSSTFPTSAGCYDNSFNGGTSVTPNGFAYTAGSDIFVAKLSATGASLLASTFIGGTANDGFNINATLSHNYSDEMRGEIVLGAAGEVYVCSSTSSTNFPTTAGALATVAPAAQNGCAFKMNNGLTSLLWSTYIGGTNADAAYSIKPSTSGNVFVTGGTLSTNFPITPGTIRTTNAGGADGYVVSLSGTNGSQIAGSYFGTTAYDQTYLLEIDLNNDVYVAGQTKGAYVVTGGVYSNPGSSQFIHKFNPALTTTDFSTVFGTGSTTAIDISLTAFLVDNCQNIYVSGWGGSTNNEGATTGLPVTGDAYDATTDGSDFYFIVLERDAQSLLYGSFFGGSPAEHVDGGTSRFDKNGTIYQAVCAGCGGSDNFPTTPGVWSNTNNSTNCNLGALKMEFNYLGIVASANAAPNIIACDPPYDVTFQGSSTAVNHFWDFGDGSPDATTLNPIHTFTSVGNFTVMYVAIDSSTCNIADTVYLSVQILAAEIFDATFDIPPYNPCVTGTFDIDLEFTGSGADSLFWNMGNGTTFIDDTLINYTYPAGGTYIVSLTAYDFVCNKVETFTDTVDFTSTFTTATANAAPNVIRCDPPFDVTFTGGSTPNHYWDFGDGSPVSTIANPTHTFSGLGNYTIMYVAIDSSTCNITDTVYLTVDVLAPEIFSATLDIAPYDPCIDTNFTVNLDFTGTGADSLYWSMGDGATYSDTTISHTYTADGTYIISLTAYDFTCNKIETITDTVTFNSSITTAVANAAPNVIQCDPPFNVTFTGGTTPGHLWDFGDGSPLSSSASPTHTYTGLGNYIVMYVAIDSTTCNVTDTAYLTVDVLASEIFSATLDIAPYDPCVASSFTVNLDFTGSGADSLHWNMGDGTTYQDTTITHTYASDGTYIISLTAYDFTCNKVETITDTVTFNSSITTAVANAAPNVIQCDPPFNVTFTGGSTPGHLWDFGDGSPTSSSASPTHTYTGLGNFIVMYVAIDSSTCNVTDTVYLTVDVLASETFSATLNIAPYDPCVATNFTVNLDFTGSGADSIYWNMGDGTTYADTTVSHTYGSDGTYIVTMTAYDFTCNKVETITDTVTFNSSIVNASANAAPNVIACDPPFDVNFTGGTTPNHLWDFDDGSPVSNVANPAHTFSTTGNYNVMYVAIDSSTCNVTDTAYVSVQILQSENFSAEFSPIPPQPCKDTVRVNITFTGSGADSLFWNMGDGTVFIDDTAISYYYTNPGTYTLSLTAYDETCNKVETITQTINVDESTLNGDIVIPNIFTPNSDGENDEFKLLFAQYPGVELAEYFEEYKLQIFNRWGKKVFETDSGSWNGTIDGKAAADGVYFFIVSYNEVCLDEETTTKTGHVTIVR
jgi:gliding motility-associated-like protein